MEQMYVWFTECGIITSVRKDGEPTSIDEPEAIAHHQLHEYTLSETTEIIKNWVDGIDNMATEILEYNFEYDFHRFEVVANIDGKEIPYYMAFKKAIINP